jgi:hypothetical protein
MSGERVYRGGSKAVHVTENSFSVTPSSPQHDVSVYYGLSSSIVTNAASPDQWDDSQILGSGFMSGIYRGRSPAIHVYGGTPSEWPPVDPIPACEDAPLVPVIDTFTRSIDGSWGVNDYGVGYANSDIGDQHYEVNGSRGVMELIAETYPLWGTHFFTCWQRMLYTAQYQFPEEMLVDYEFDGAYEDTHTRLTFYFGGPFWPDHAILDIKVDTNSVELTHSDATPFEIYDTVVGSRRLRVHVSNESIKYKLWTPGYTEPVGWTAELAGTNPLISGNTVFEARFGQNRTGGIFHAAAYCYFDNLWLSGWEHGPCPDPETGEPLPPFTPGYMPIFRHQIGDPTTNLDGYICTLESAAMVLDWHTRGAVQVWGGELIPWCGKSEYDIVHDPGTGLHNAQMAWHHYGQYLDIRSGTHWHDLMACLAEGRAVILLGDYDQLSLAERCQGNFFGNHAISVYPYQTGSVLLIGDPLCHNFKGMAISTLIRYAEDMGAQIYGVTSPQKILFAVSRPWVP